MTNRSVSLIVQWQSISCQFCFREHGVALAWTAPPTLSLSLKKDSDGTHEIVYSIADQPADELRIEDAKESGWVVVPGDGQQGQTYICPNCLNRARRIAAAVNYGA